MAKSALIVVDVQRDFCAGGALAAADTLSLLTPLAHTVDAARRAGAVIVFTMDWHPVEHSSFLSNGGPWPVHCVAGTRGAELMPPVEARPGDLVIRKGVDKDGPGYSGFEGTPLARLLNERQVERVAISGIATEYCVRATALDARKAGFQTVVLRDAIRAVEEGETKRVLDELGKSGVALWTVKEWVRGLEQ